MVLARLGAATAVAAGEDAAADALTVFWTVDVVFARRAATGIVSTDRGAAGATVRGAIQRILAGE